MSKKWLPIFIILDILLAVGAGITGDMHLKNTSEALTTISTMAASLLVVWLFIIS